RFIITERGYMGLAPPDAEPSDIVVVLGGPGTAFHTRVVPSMVRTPISQLRGPCYLHGIMDGEL
ncbi:hypothetical protein EK21DRAFT_46965, partial [Setomelanomma holmii]